MSRRRRNEPRNHPPSVESRTDPLSASAKPDAHTTLLCCAIITGATILVYAPLLHPGFEFLTWDDTSNIVENPLLHSSSATHFLSLWASATLGVFEPLGISLKLLLVRTFGMHVQPFQLTTLFLHLVNAGLLFVVARRLVAMAQPEYELEGERGSARENLAGLIASLFYALHPLRVEAVAWASAQSYVMAATFFLLATWAHLKHCEIRSASNAWRPNRYFALSLLLFVCALLSKSAAIFLPAVLLVIDFYPLRRRRWLELVLEKAPFGALGVAAAGAAFWATARAQIGNSLDLDITTRCAYALRSFLFHVRLTVWPDLLLPTYPVIQEVANPFSESFLIYTIGFATLCVLAWRLHQRAPWFSAVWCAYGVGLLPVSGLVPHGAWTLGADRYTYMTTFGFYILLGGWAASPGILPKLSFDNSRGRIVAVSISVALCLLGFSTHRQLQHWKNTEALWSYTVAQDPANPMALNNLGFHYLLHERYGEAIPLLAVVVAVDPGNLKAVLNFGFSLEKAGRLEEAVGSYRRALLNHPESGALHNNISVIYHKLGNEEAAKRHAEHAELFGFRR